MGDKNSAENQRAAQYTANIISGFGRFLRLNDFDASLYECDTLVLLNGVKRYLDDVERLHRHHDIKHIDCYKIAGYLSYWICKMKPFRAKDASAVYTSSRIGLANESFYINELFSLHMGLARINAHYKHIKSSLRVILSLKHYDMMAYSLKYRQASGDMLALFFEMADAFSSGAVDSEVDLLYMYRQLSEDDKAKTTVIVRDLVKLGDKNARQAQNPSP